MVLPVFFCDGEVEFHAECSPALGLSFVTRGGKQVQWLSVCEQWFSEPWLELPRQAGDQLQERERHIDWGPPMHHKKSDSVEIQEKWISRKCEKIKKLEKSFFSLFPQNRTNSDEFGRNPKNKAPCFPQYEFLCGRSRTIFLSVFPKNSGKLGKLQKNNGRI